MAQHVGTVAPDRRYALVDKVGADNRGGAVADADLAALLGETGLAVGGLQGEEEFGVIA